MARNTSRSGQRWLAVTLAIAALVTAAWFFPELPGRKIEPVDMPVREWSGEGEDGITVFRTAEELKHAVQTTEGAELPAVNFDSMELIRVRSRAVGYTTEGDTEARYGTISYDSRLGGYRPFVYLYEPKPSRLWQFGIDVSSSFSGKDRERWFVVPKDTHLEFGESGMALYDLIFGVLTGLLLFALVLVVARIRWLSAYTTTSQPGFQQELASASFLR